MNKKKILLWGGGGYFALCVIGIIISGITSLFGCGGKSTSHDNSIKGENGKSYENYQECCAANDYQAAHQFLARLQNSGDDSEKYKEAKEYVFKNEALYLMSQDDETAKKRIIYLLKEEGGNNDHVSMLIDLAIENDDEVFVRTLANQYTEGVSDESLKKLIEYLADKPNEDNKKYIENLISKYLSLSNTTMLKYLAGTKGKENSEKILGLLAEIEKDIPTRPALGLVKYEYDDPCADYNEAIKNYNDVCQTILDIAIASKNQYLAQRVISKAKPGLTSKNLGDWVRVVEKEYDHSSLYDAFRISIDNSSTNSIKAAYQEAVRSGAFR